MMAGSAKMMRACMKTTWISIVALTLACVVAGSAIAQDDFYRNKQIRLIVGHPVGNDHDVGGRLWRNISASTFPAVRP